MGKRSEKRRPSYEDGKVRDPRIAKMQAEPEPRRMLFRLIRKAARPKG